MCVTTHLSNKNIDTFKSNTSSSRVRGAVSVTNSDSRHQNARSSTRSSCAEQAAGVEGATDVVGANEGLISSRTARRNASSNASRSSAVSELYAQRRRKSEIRAEEGCKQSALIHLLRLALQQTRAKEEGDEHRKENGGDRLERGFQLT